MRDLSDDGKSAVNFFAQNLLRDGKFAVKLGERRGFFKPQNAVNQLWTQGCAWSSVTGKTK